MAQSSDSVKLKMMRPSILFQNEWHKKQSRASSKIAMAIRAAILLEPIVCEKREEAGGLTIPEVVLISSVVKVTAPEVKNKVVEDVVAVDGIASKHCCVVNKASKTTNGE